MIIRSAKLQDLPRVLELFQRFLVDTRVERDDSLPYNEAMTWKTFAGLVVSPFGNIVLAEEDGAIMAVLAIQASQQFFCVEYVATELFWYVAPEYRGRGLSKSILLEAEGWARSLGATCILMGLHSSSPDHARTSYERSGYRLSQSAYIKRLT